MSSDSNFTVTSKFLGNVCVRPYLKHTVGGGGKWSKIWKICRRIVVKKMSTKGGRGQKL